MSNESESKESGMTVSLQKELTQTNMKCVPDGLHHIEVIYEYVQEAYPEECDNEVVCDTGWADSPEWQHKVRNALQTLKGKGRIHKTGLERGYWRVQVNLDGKALLDACCGARSIWFDKEHAETLYMDIREEEPGTIKLQPGWSVEPDIIGDYRDMVFPDESFWHIMWDIPHIMEAKSGIMLQKYGKLGHGWKEDVTRGFNECWRVLKPFGTLVFKWCDLSISTSEMLAQFPEKPLHGTRTKKSVNEHGTYWILFFKLPPEMEMYQELWTAIFQSMALLADGCEDSLERAMSTIRSTMLDLQQKMLE